MQQTDLERKAALMAEIASKRSMVAPVPTEIGQNSISQWTSRMPLNLPLADKFELAANLFVEQAINEVVGMKSKDAMVAAGIAVEKMQLLRGLPTEIVLSAAILIKIGERAASEGFTLREILEALWEQMSGS